MRSRGFTLVELLVVIGIVTLLLGILVPVVGKARQSANRASCRAQLRDIGSMFQMYLNESKNRLPHVASMPSLKLDDRPSIVQVLAPYHRNATKVFRCPSDVIRTGTRQSADVETYYEQEGSSFQPSMALYSNGGSQLQKIPMFERRPELMWILNEYEAFHGTPSSNGSMNILFADMHVGDFAEM